MNNIHILPTDKPSRLIINWEKDLCYKSKPYLMKGTQNIYITSDEEIKENDWGLSKLNEVILFGRSYNEKFYKKIILTTDQDLIKDGVQAIDDEFLEWFVKNPTCESVEVINFCCGQIDGKCNPQCIRKSYEIIIAKEQPKQETTLEEFAIGFACTITQGVYIVEANIDQLEKLGY